MAGDANHQEGRKSGWPPVRTDRFPIDLLPSDNLVLAILWALVVAGLLTLAALAIPVLFGWASKSVEAASAFEELPGNVEQPPITPAEVAGSQPASAPREHELDLSGNLGVAFGNLLESSLHSEALGMDLPFRIYLPPGYYSSKERYPVLYLLHGSGGNFTEWTEGNWLATFADALIFTGRIRPMLIVTPEGDNSYFMNQAGGQRWADYAKKDLVQAIDSRYRSLADRRHRAIGGHSMGGEGALQLAFNNPEVFSIVGAHSPSLHLSLQDAPAYFGDWGYYGNYDPIRLTANMESAGSLQIWVDTADQDPWLEATEQLHTTLVNRGINHEWHLYPGVHFTSYWIEHTPRYLEFYSSAFTRNGIP